MKIWIVWLPNVWKSTLFNALTNTYSADSQNYPFCTIEPNIWTVLVKDERVNELWRISNSQKIIYANINFFDIAGLVRWASKWEWLWNKFLSHIREVDAIVQVVRHFKDDNIIHVDWNVDALRDIDTINTELIISDLEQLESKFSNIWKRIKLWEKDAQKWFDSLEKAKKILWEWKLLFDCLEEFDEEELTYLKQFNFLTLRPFIYAFNVSEYDLKNYKQIQDFYFEKLHKPVCIFCAKLESDMIWLSNDEKNEYLNSLKWDDINLKIPTLDELIKISFDKVWLMYFFTSWEKETRAWTIKKNTKAPKASSVIHSDIEKWFIKAEVVEFDNFIKFWWWSKSRENWVLRVEWKEYEIKDWDVVFFKFNV